MKKSLLILLVISMLAAACACQAGNVVPTPTPLVTLKPTATLPPAPLTSPTSPGGTSVLEGIVGFKEGTVVVIEEISVQVKNAIDAQYPDAQLKSVTHALYQSQQVYKVELTEKDATTTQTVYVSAQGVILPAGSSALSSPAVSPKS